MNKSILLVDDNSDDVFLTMRALKKNNIANEITKLLPVVVLTASREDSGILKSYKMGCNAYVRKPVEFEQFAEAIRRLGLFWLLLNEPPNLARG
jgi:CheY-like chemotaxis protein